MTAARPEVVPLSVVPAPPPATAPPVRRSLAALRRRWPVLVIAALAGALVAGAWGAVRPRSYAADAEVLLAQRDPIATLLRTGGPPPQPERAFETQVALITVEPVASDVIRRLRLDEPPDRLLGRVSTAVQGRSGLVSIEATASDPVLAARIANAFARAYRSFDAASDERAVDQLIAAARERLRRVGGEATPEGRGLAGTIRRLEAAAAFQAGDVQLIRRARPPAGPAGLGPLALAVIGALAAAALAAAWVAARARLDRRIHMEADAERAAGAPVVARVPRRGPGSGGDDAAERRAYAGLAARLVAARLPRVVLVAAPDRSGSAAAVTLGLARALRTVGRRALAVEADLRSPRFAAELGLAPCGGLAAVLAGRASLASELVAVPGGEPPRRGRPAPGAAAAHALPAGRAPAAPHGLLSSDAMLSLLRQARRHADVVLLTGAPLGRAPDALVLAPLAERALLVVAAGRTPEAAAAGAARDLRDAGVGIAGVVLTGVPRGWAAGLADARRVAAAAWADAAAGGGRRRASRAGRLGRRRRRPTGVGT